MIFEKKKLLNIKRVFRFSLQLLSETFLILRRTERDIDTNVKTSSYKVSVILVTCKWARPSVWPLSLLSDHSYNCTDLPPLDHFLCTHILSCLNFEQCSALTPILLSGDTFMTNVFNFCDWSSNERGSSVVQISWKHYIILTGYSSSFCCNKTSTKTEAEAIHGSIQMLHHTSINAKYGIL